LALGALALAACTESQTPEPTGVEATPAPIDRSLPLVQSARVDLARAPQPSSTTFNIRLRFVSTTTNAQRQVFRKAAARWQEIIVKDVPSISGRLPADLCGPFGTPVFNGTIDDILIDVILQPIDGPGNVLGAAGPCVIRFADDLPAYGLMFFDTADLDFIASLDLLDEVVIHEMGHVLGFGTLWNFNRALLLNERTRNPRFRGPAAMRQWHNLGGESRVPVEGDFGPGTADSHWDEETFDNELMTGFLTLGDNVLSNMTAGSMRDIGYDARLRGDPYQLPSPTSAIAALKRAGEGLDIASRERLLTPKGAIK
jgi:hypothetical protein